jgi:Mn-containing catalase
LVRVEAGCSVVIQEQALNNGQDSDAGEVGGAGISGAPFEAMRDVHLAAAFLSHGGAVPVNSNG